MHYFEGRSLSDYLGFIRPSTKMRYLFYLTQSILRDDMAFSKESIELLQCEEQRRRQAQIEMEQINDLVQQVCMACEGQCCRGSYDHYSSIDYVVRLHGEHSLTSYGQEDEKSVKRLSVVTDRMLRIVKNKDILFTGQNRSGCPLLGSSGCTIKGDERPIKCLTFTCVRMRNAMSRDMKREYAKNITALLRVSSSVFEIVKRDTATPKYYGTLQLMTVL